MENEYPEWHKGNIYIVSWDMTGLECVIDANELMADDVMNALKDEKGSALGRTLFVLTTRARANSHRHYEIYSIHTTPDVEKEAIEQMFEDNPQAAADLIRERGNKIWSDRANKKTQVIT